MAKPSVALVREWITSYASDVVTVQYGTAVFDEDYWKVIAKGKTKYFYGETAWSDAERYARDAEFEALRS